MPRSTSDATFRSEPFDSLAAMPWMDNGTVSFGHDLSHMVADQVFFVPPGGFEPPLTRFRNPIQNVYPASSNRIAPAIALADAVRAGGVVAAR